MLDDDDVAPHGKGGLFGTVAWALGGVVCRLVVVVVVAAAVAVSSVLLSASSVAVVVNDRVASLGCQDQRRW